MDAAQQTAAGVSAAKGNLEIAEKTYQLQFEGFVVFGIFLVDSLIPVLVFTRAITSMVLGAIVTVGYQNLPFLMVLS